MRSFKPHLKDYKLVKLPQYGITGNLWCWFSNHLYNHLQCVKICSCISDPLPVQSGVPQRSILGPLLFLMTIIQSSKPFLFANDAKLLKIIKQLSNYQLLQQDLDQIHIWTISLMVIYYSALTSAFRISFNNKTPTTYSIDSTILPQLHTHRDLGLILSDDLYWRNHYEHTSIYITSKAYKYVGLLRRAFSSCHSVNAKKLFTLTYCMIVVN